MNGVAFDCYYNIWRTRTIYYNRNYFVIKQTVSRCQVYIVFASLSTYAIATIGFCH